MGMAPFLFMEETMTQVLPTRRSLHFAEALIHYRRHQSTVQLEHENIVYPLTASWSDTVHVFEHRQRLYVLTVNLKQTAIRLDVFAGKLNEALHSLTLTEPAEIEAILGQRWRKLSPKSMAVLLADRLAGKDGAA
jgi:hypothetical protein